MKKIILLIVFLIFMISCKKVSVSAAEMNPSELKDEILENGDRKSYINFEIFQNGKKIDKDFLSISLLMYEKYNYIKSLRSIYFAFIYKNNPNIPFMSGNINELFVKIPKKEQEIALNYLKIGLKKDDYSCIQELINHYKYIGETKKSSDLIIYQDKLVEENYKRIRDSINKKNPF